MTAIGKAFVVIADTAVDPDSPLDSALITGLRDNHIHLREWLGASYVGGAVQNHNHDGANSAAIEIGPNWLRNGNFENGTSGWTLTNYTGGTVATNTANETEGTTGLSITSTNAGNGGGNALSDEYIGVVAGQLRQVMMTIKASGATVPIKAEAIWYDDGKAQISATTLISTTTASPITDRLLVRRVAAPATAKYLRVKLELPAAGAATGTVYFDGVVVGLPALLGGEQVFTASGTFSAVLGDVFVEVQGGGAGGLYVSASQGNGGSAGGYSAGPVITSGDVSVTVGAAGAGGTSGTPGGTAGGTSSFGAFLSATGGAVNAGAGGIGTGGALNVTGQSGGEASVGSSISAAGGNAVLGLGGASVNQSAGLPATGYGAGGGGAENTGTANGGAGAPGVVRVRW